MRTIAVGSTNPVKLESARSLSRLAEFSYVGVAAESGVPGQPMGEEQTFEGAVNRAKDALAKSPGADYGLGIEGGCRDDGETMWCFAVCAIVDKDGRVGKGVSGEFALPARMREMVLSGIELGDADDRMFGRQNSKQQDGVIGVLTHGRFPRAEFNSHAVLCAFIPFLHPELYPQGAKGKE